MRETLKKTNLKNKEGITLIALVITIIVLLILAGVAISMLSGENGILTRASEAKIQTEETQKDERAALLSYEMALKGNSKYKYQYGYVTGFGYEQDERISIKQFEEELPDGYTVEYKYNVTTKEDETITNKDERIATGMAIVKDGKEVARTIVFGDVNCDGLVEIDDATELIKFCLLSANCIEKEFQKLAANINSDDELNGEDLGSIESLCNWKEEDEYYEELLNQSIIIKYEAKDLKRCYKEGQEYINSVDTDTTGLKFEYDSKTDTYKLKGVKEDTTVETLKNALPNSEYIRIYKEDNRTEVDGSEKVKTGYYLRNVFEKDKGVTKVTSYFVAYIEVEK